MGLLLVPPGIGQDNGCRILWWPLHYNQSLAWRLPRPILVFWPGVVAGKMTFLITVEIRDLINVMYLLLFLRNIGGVEVGGWSLLFPFLSMFPPLTLEPLLLIFSVVFLRWLHRIVRWWDWLWILRFGFFGARQVLGALGLPLEESVVRWAVAPRAMNIRVPNHGAGS